MNTSEQNKLLDQARTWFAEVVMENHKANTLKLAKLSKFQVNPFLHTYLAAFLTGEVTPDSLAKVLLLPRILGNFHQYEFWYANSKIYDRCFERGIW
jgi:hypothetical protein